ncbi:MAG: Rieske (2Fe-2S) protein [Deltaproteobacteria bacterium]|nr:Rieske (2Fe-2S) protein [Deltaproteobacteria bacterium]
MHDDLAPPSPSRRALLEGGLRLGLGLCAWACGGCGGPTGKDSAPVGASGVDSAAGGGDGGATDGCAEAPDALDASWVAVPLAANPGLAEVGGGVALDLSGRRLVVAQPSAGCFVAVDRACTHQGCDVAFREGRFLCPCHGAAFDLDGAVLSGPTPVPLASYPAALRGEVVWVKTG